MAHDSRHGLELGGLKYVEIELYCVGNTLSDCDEPGCRPYFVGDQFTPLLDFCAVPAVDLLSVYVIYRWFFLMMSEGTRATST